jgi:hypothetical protein
MLPVSRQEIRHFAASAVYRQKKEWSPADSILLKCLILIFDL